MKSMPMRTMLAAAAITVAASVGVGAQKPSSPADRFVGNWGGVLATPAAKLHLMLTLARDSAGGLTGTMISVDQGNAKIPATFSVRADTLVVAMPAAQATYTAVFRAAGDSLYGSFN